MKIKLKKLKKIIKEVAQARSNKLLEADRAKLMKMYRYAASMIRTMSEEGDLSPDAEERLMQIIRSIGSSDIEMAQRLLSNFKSQKFNHQTGKALRNSGVMAKFNNVPSSSLSSVAL